MRKFITLRFLFVITLSGCTQNTGLSQDQLFEKKQECAEYKIYLEQEIDTKSKELVAAGGIYNEDIKEIFYSIPKNSCFAITESIRILSNNEKVENKIIIDLLSDNVMIYDKKSSENMTYYNEKIKELKEE